MKNWLSARRSSVAHVWGRLALGGVAVAAISIAWWVVRAATASQVQMVAALLTPAVALLAVVIAAAQWHIARNKLKLDLFDRRYAVFSLIEETLRKAVTKKSVRQEEIDEYVAATQSVAWLFGDETAVFAHDVALLLYDLMDLENRMERSLKFADTEDFEVAGVARGETLKCLVIHRLQLGAKFGDFLRLQH